MNMRTPHHYERLRALRDRLVEGEDGDAKHYRQQLTTILNSVVSLGDAARARAKAAGPDTNESIK